MIGAWNDPSVGATLGQGAALRQAYRAGQGSDVQWPGGRLANRAMRRGFQSLFDIISSRGATDPRLMNEQELSIRRDTEAQQQAFQQALAASGMGGSGVGLASYGAIGAGGAGRLATMKASEAALAEERKRQDLELLLNLIINPRLAYRAQNLGLQAQQDQNSNASAAARAAAISSLLGMVGRMYGTSAGPGPTQT